MKATINEDIIVAVGKGLSEIGAVPKGVGLERLRWDGQRVVDLAGLDIIWVRHRNGVFELHAVQVPNSQAVIMRYSDRKRLVIVSGIIRAQTQEEIAAKETASTLDKADNKNLRDEMVTLVKNLTFAKVDDHIDQVFGALNQAQKTSLKTLYKVVLYLAKSSLRRS